jgi:predicted nucleotidyltransferase
MILMELNLSQKRQLKECAEKYQIELMVLFGSQVKGRPYQESDFDLAYLSRKKDFSGKEIIALNCHLMDIFSYDRVDLVDLRKTDPFLRYEIARNSQLLYGKEMDYLEFKAFAFKDYIDHQSLFDLNSVLIRRRHQLLKEKIYGK